MFAPTKEQIALLTALNSTYRFVIEGPTMLHEDGKTQPKIVKDGKTICYIIDETMGQEYCSGEGQDQRSSFDAAISKAKDAPKPKTPAQQFSDASNDEKDKKIKELEAQLADARRKVKKPSLQNTED